MKYDIFISYSRKDFNEVNAFLMTLCEHIPNLTYWFDITGIESGDEFDDKIITAIDNSRCVLFMLSDNSLASNWSKDEVVYAKNTKKKVIPILLKGHLLTTHPIMVVPVQENPIPRKTPPRYNIQRFVAVA